MEKATLAGGCFWCTEEIFRRLKGVKEVVSGYSGGFVDNPTQEQVYSDTTGHAEAIQITFDPSVVSYEDLLHVFFKLHDPTTKNRQGADVGPQYRSAIFYHGDEQKRLAEKSKIARAGEYGSPIVTEITAASEFYPAEEYHQKYILKGGAAACRT